MGIFEVVDDWFKATEKTWADELELGQLIYPWQTPIRPVQLGTVDFMTLVQGLKFVEKKKKPSIYLQGTLANMCRPVGEEDYQLILAKMREPPIQVIFLPKKPP